MKEELNGILFDSNNKFIRNRFRDDFFRKYHPFLYEKINKKIDDRYTFKEKIYILYYNIDVPRCKSCGNKVDLISFNKGFHTFCCTTCAINDKEIRDKIKQTNLKKYGVEHPQKNRDVRNKTKKTIRNRFGVDSLLESEEIKEKIRQTNLRKYGVNNPSQSKEIKDKIKQTNLKKFGVEHNSYSKLVVDKRKKTFLEKYGVDNPNKLSEIIDKRNCTITNNYVNKCSKILRIDKSNIVSSVNGDVIIKNYCEKHKQFKISKQNLFNRVKYGFENMCTKCNPISKQYIIKEGEFINFIKTFNLDLIEKDRKILKGREIDVLIPEHKLGFEFNGLFWHSDYHKDKKYHLDKTEMCEKRGIQLIHVFEDEWTHKKEIVKSIIKSKLGFFDVKIFARKCEVKEIYDNKLINDFLENNHIQGFVGSTHKIGLFYENELVSLMTFGKKRTALGNKKHTLNDYEMLRFCNKLNTQVIGGASRLFKFFLLKYTPNSVISYADRRYSQGGLYEKLNFKFNGNTEVNYWYFNKNELIRYHRYNFRKDVLVKMGFDSNKTEREIMIERHFYRIYDCGNIKYIWTNN